MKAQLIIHSITGLIGFLIAHLFFNAPGTFDKLASNYYYFLFGIFTFYILWVNPYIKELNKNKQINDKNQV